MIKYFIHFFVVGILCFSTAFGALASNGEESRVAMTSMAKDNKGRLMAIHHVLPYSQVTYSLENKRYLGDLKGKIITKTRNEPPGVTLNLDMVSVSTTLYPSVIESIVQVIGLNLGFDIAGTTTLTTGVSWQIPSTYEGKKVQYAKMSTRTVEEVWCYDVYIKINEGEKTHLKRGIIKRLDTPPRSERNITFTDGTSIVV